MKVQQIFFNNTLRNFSYLINFDDGATYCIDPLDSKEVKAALGNGKTLTAIINTHDHCDHYSGNEALQSLFNCEVFCHTDGNVPGKSAGLADGECIHEFGEWALVAVDTPGHTFSHLSLLLLQNKIPYALFTGDCFFNAGVGNCYNGGDPKILFKTMEEIFKKWPDELLIYPGHEYLKKNLEFTLEVEKENISAKNFLMEIKNKNLDEVFHVTNMRKEREINSFLRLESQDIREKLEMRSSSAEALFIKLRELRNKW